MKRGDIVKIMYPKEGHTKAEGRLIRKTDEGDFWNVLQDDIYICYPQWSLKYIKTPTPKILKEGNLVMVLNPVKPHTKGHGTITKVEMSGDLIYQVEQNGSNQWYGIWDLDGENLIDYTKWKGLDTNTQNKENIDDEAWKEYENQKLCDQYKEAISEATEDLKNGNYGLRVNSTSTGVEPCMLGESWSLKGKIYNAASRSGMSESRILKQALALLAEQKQNELKEIEELIKKL